MQQNPGFQLPVFTDSLRDLGWALRLPRLCFLSCTVKKSLCPTRSPSKPPKGFEPARTPLESQEEAQRRAIVKKALALFNLAFFKTLRPQRSFLVRMLSSQAHEESQAEGSNHHPSWLLSGLRVQEARGVILVCKTRHARGVLPFFPLCQ